MIFIISREDKSSRLASILFFVMFLKNASYFYSLAYEIFLFWKMLMVVNSALGADGLSRFPFIKEQASGGYLALCLIAVWLSRRHLGRVWRKVLCHCQQPRPINSGTMPMNQCVTEPPC